MSGSETTTSKRSALRFSGYNRPLSYKTDYEDGEARLVNISTNGCAIIHATTELLIDQKILIHMLLDAPDNPLQIQAVVIRAETDSFGLQFLHTEEKHKHRLIRFFAKETRRQKSNPSSTPD